MGIGTRCLNPSYKLRFLLLSVGEYPRFCRFRDQPLRVLRQQEPLINQRARRAADLLDIIRLIFVALFE